MAISIKQPLSDVSHVYLNMKLEIAHKRLMYQESIWPVKEMELMEENRKLHLRIALLERDVEGAEKELMEMHAKLNQTHEKCELAQSKTRLLSEDKERMHRESLSLQKQLDYYRGETQSLQKKMKDADNVLSEKMALTRQVIALQLDLENERRTTARTTKNAAERGDSEKSLQKEIQELKAQLGKQTQLTEKVKGDNLKAKQEWEKQKTVLESKLEKERNRNKNLQEKKGVKRKASEEQVTHPLLSPLKPPQSVEPKPVSIIAPPPETKKPVPKKPQPALSEFSTTPFFVRQGSVIPQASPSLGNTSILGRAVPVFGGSKSKRSVSATTATRLEETGESTPLEDDASFPEISGNTSLLTDVGCVPKKKKRKLNGGTGNRTLFAVPDESPVHGLAEFGVSTLMMDSPTTQPKFAGNHLLSTVKKPKGGLLWNMKKGGLKLDKNGSGVGLISPEKTSEKMKDIKKAFTLKL